MWEICESYGKKKGGPWECYYVNNFYGWEAERVVAVTTGDNILEVASRAKTELILILAEPEKEEHKKSYQRFQVVVKAAVAEGQVDLQVSESENNNNNNNNNSSHNIINKKLNTI